MNRGSTLFLRGVIYLIGLAVLALCVVGLPRLIMSEMKGDFDFGWLFVGLYVTAIPFFIALYQSLRLLGLIDRNMAFSEESVRAFRNIKYCGLSISGLFLLGMPYIFYLADMDDAPGLAAFGFAIIFASFVIATFAAVLQKLIQSAVDLKSENDLTV
jgi:hypothetical protein